MDYNKGLPGCRGDRGPKGDEGPRGKSGKDGKMGPTGAAGINGATGPTGATGAVGPIGPQGPQGPLGPVGPTGPTGQDGNSVSLSFASYYYLGPDVGINNNWSVPYNSTFIETTGALETGTDGGPANWTNGWRCSETGIYYVTANAANEGGGARYVLAKGAGVFIPAGNLGSTGATILAGGLTPSLDVGTGYNPGARMDVNLSWCGQIIAGEKVMVLWSDSSNSAGLSDSVQYLTPTNSGIMEGGIKFHLIIIRLG